MEHTDRGYSALEAEEWICFYPQDSVALLLAVLIKVQILQHKKRVRIVPEKKFYKTGHKGLI